MGEPRCSIFDRDRIVVARATARLDAPTTEGDRVLHMLTGLAPLVR